MQVVCILRLICKQTIVPCFPRDGVDGGAVCQNGAIGNMFSMVAALPSVQVLGLRAPVKEEGEKGKEAEEGREGEEEAVEPEFDDETVNQAMEKALKEDAEIDVPPAMYVAPPPTELPIGALTQLKQQADEQRMVQAMEANSIAEAGAAKEAGAGEAAGSQPRKQVKVKGGKRGRKGAK